MIKQKSKTRKPSVVDTKPIIEDESAAFKVDDIKTLDSKDLIEFVYNIEKLFVQSLYRWRETLTLKGSTRLRNTALRDFKELSEDYKKEIKSRIEKVLDM